MGTGKNSTTATGPGVDISIDDPVDALSRVRSHSAGGDEGGHLNNLRAQQFSVAQGQQELLAVEEIKDRIQLLEHQLNAAHKALFKCGEGALFADEVGLGKTIEVGMVLKEMDFRGTHQSFLVLTPAQLAPQWQGELKSKFDLDFVCNYDEDFKGFDAHDRIVASVDTAKSKSYKDQVLSRRWDVVVLDEAHCVRNHDTQRYKLLEEIDYGNAYFATATPLQNDITDLFNITNLIHEGLLGSRKEFKRRYLVDGDPTKVKNAEELQNRLDQIMIRTPREKTQIDFAKREVHKSRARPSPDERDLYDGVTEYVRNFYSSEGARHLVMKTLQKEVVSSPAAVSGTVRKWLNDGQREMSQYERSFLENILEFSEQIETTTKQEQLQSVIENAQEFLSKTQVVVFTQFRATQDVIADGVRELGEAVYVVNGDYSSKEKDRIIAEFEEEGGVLVATDSISEGRNLQFCNVLVNYDLPWNPMKVEQRIGRIDRIGQERDVHVFNLALKGTVEDDVLEKLYGKIDLFNASIGGLREILSQTEQSGSDFEQEIFERLRNADSKVELENNFEEMAVDLETNQEAAEKMTDFNDQVFDKFDFSGDSA